MQFRRHMPPLREWRVPEVIRRRAARWSLWGIGAVLAGYLTAYLLIFPTPILHGRQVVPRVLGLSSQDAGQQIRNAGFDVREGGGEPHPTAPAGTVIWQDPPAGVNAPAGLRVTLVVSAGPPKIPVPDVSGLEGSLAQRLVSAAGLTVAQVESVQAAAPTGITMLTRPAAGSLLLPAGGVIVVVSRGAPTIPVPDLLGMSVADARTRLEAEGLQVGTVTRRRTAESNPGTVVGQKPAAGTLAAPGTVVDLIVARSPQ
jgi:beta-lactam-binding protein with PASTA domain